MPGRAWPAISSWQVTATFRLVYVLLVLEIGTRRIVHWNITEHPTAEWTAQQFRSFLTGDEPYRFVIHPPQSAIWRRVSALDFARIHSRLAAALC
jgi:hypothetical protein